MILIHRIYKKILKIYPFLTSKEKRLFISRSKPLLIRYPKASTLEEKISFIRSLLFLLNNGHADLIRTKKRKMARKKLKLFKPKIELHARQRTLFIIIPSWSKDLGDIQHGLISTCVKNRKKYDAILIDVRDNSGGNSRIAHDFASIFFNKSIKYGIFVSKGRNNKLRREIGLLKPHKKIYINALVAILISGKCFSSNELFLAPFKVSGRAVLIGDRTRGGSANPLSQKISIEKVEMVVRIPRWRFFLKGKKKPLEETKINPTVVYREKNIISFAERYLKTR